MKRVLMDITEDLSRIALVENGEPVEIYYAGKRQESIVGNLYAGRIENVIPTLQAAFVDIGTGKNAYLYYGRERAVSDAEKKQKPKGGSTVLVQVEKDAVGSKGAVVTERISFAGKFLVLLPKEGGEIRISRKITQDEERERIRSILSALLPPSCGVIVRTNGKGQDRQAYEKELHLLLEKWESVQKAVYQKPPMLIWQENIPVLQAARDFYSSDVDSFLVNDEKAYEMLLATGDFNGEGQPLLEWYQEKTPLFASFYLESKLEKALDQRVWLKSGGFLIIEETEACVVIDVNTGKMNGKGDLEKTIRKTNLEAAEEVAKQLRLRNLSGIIIVDFVDMVHEEDRNIVTKALEKAVAKDRIKTVVVGMTELGLMQITRKKIRPSLLRQVTTKCRSCQGRGSVFSIDWTVSKMRRETESIFTNTIYRQIEVVADKRLLYAYLGEDAFFAADMEKRFGGQILIKEQAGTPFGWYQIEQKAYL